MCRQDMLCRSTHGPCSLVCPIGVLESSMEIWSHLLCSEPTPHIRLLIQQIKFYHPAWCLEPTTICRLYHSVISKDTLLIAHSRPWLRQMIVCSTYPTVFTKQPSRLAIYGSCSLILYIVLLQLIVKYILITLYADDNEEGMTGKTQRHNSSQTLISL